ncbi:prephenate dehydratase [Streptomyces sp. NPDC053431]|uniref:prephenate dehydratase n=1 Tax=Streptomyces sp. NPDC053431 TaxID=3365703 RepID=UPI0037D8D252
MIDPGMGAAPSRAPLATRADIKRIAYLGPEGSFTHEALLGLPCARWAELSPKATVTDALDSVRYREADAAMVPMENSVAGPVAETVLCLRQGPPWLDVTCEVAMAITFSLLARQDLSMSDIRTVAGHPHALPQTRQWLKKHLPQADWCSTSSNSEAARRVAQGEFDAALAGVSAAQRWKLRSLAEGISDADEAVTRFILAAAVRGSGECSGESSAA